VAGTEQDRIQVGVLFEVLLVEGGLAVARLGLAEATDGLQPLAEFPQAGGRRASAG